MMTVGQQFTNHSGSRYLVEEVDGGRAIARAVRTGARIMIVELPVSWLAYPVQDNGHPGPSLFDSLERTAGPGWATWPTPQGGTS
jgi:hypothetical protein